MADRFAQRRALLVASLGFLETHWRGYTPAAAAALQRWLHSWSGLGAVVTGMQAQGFDVELKQYPGAWRANFYTTGLAHSVMLGSAWEPTPLPGGVQRAALAALNDPRAAV